ncbi:MAG: hypothetical protein JWM28_4193 [Chitinophagaceae bacterium]|nr:hypothetical protein [Chitinophagaceae bacterium]
MNQVFNFNRCLLLIAKHWSENRKKYLLGMLAITGIILAWFGFYIVMERYRPMDPGVQYGTYYVGLFIVGCLYASTLFADLSSKSKGTNYLSVPASQLEKTLCTLLYGVVIFFIFYTLLFYFADIIMVKVGNTVAYSYWETNHSPAAVFEPQKVVNVFWTDSRPGQGEFNFLFYLLLCYFAVQSAYLLGSVYFSRFSFIKTTVGLLFIWLLLIVFVGKILNTFMPDGSFYESMASYRLNVGSDISEKIIRLPEWVNTGSLFLLKYAFAPIFWIATYFRVKEKEI